MNGNATMKLLMLLLFPLLNLCVQGQAQQSRPPRVLAFYTEKGEQDHIDFAHQAIHFFERDAAARHYTWQATQDWNELLRATPGQDQLVLWLNDEPRTPAQRSAFEAYMEQGGAWLGFHAAAYNDSGTGWPWFVRFLGGAVFKNNNWPPLPATLQVEDHDSLLTRGLPDRFASPANEWYGWMPNPRDDKDVRVFLSLAPENYPIGLKDVITGGDIPVMWTNQRYRMLYINMGHGDKIFDSPAQNGLFQRAVQLLLQSRGGPSRQDASAESHR